MKQTQNEQISFLQRHTGGEHSRITELYPGIALSFLSASGKDTIHFCHEPQADILEINYCLSGRIGWNMDNGNQIYLGPGDFSLNTMDVCANSTISLPNDFYEGIILYIDLQHLSADPPEILVGTDITGEFFRKKFCRNGTCTALAGNETIQQIFLSLYQPPEALQTAYRKIKVIELLLVLSQMENSREKHLTEYQAEQTAIIRQIHDQLVNNMEQRFSIETLSKQYLMNPTTLKKLFKAIYGTSLAAHIREHRMEHAAELLRTSNLSIADIALKVGYDSQSRFSSAFKNHFQILPKEYRKNTRQNVQF